MVIAGIQPKESALGRLYLVLFSLCIFRSKFSERFISQTRFRRNSLTSKYSSIGNIIILKKYKRAPLGLLSFYLLMQSYHNIHYLFNCLLYSVASTLLLMYCILSANSLVCSSVIFSFPSRNFVTYGLPFFVSIR